MQLTLCFKEESSDLTYKVTVCKDKFIRACREKKVNYFLGMFRFDKTGSDRMEIVVPSVLAAKSLINSILSDRFARARWITDKIYCMDYFDMDISKQFAKLFDSDIDTETFGKIHQLIDQNGYKDELHIKFMATKLPDDYDICGFPRKLLKRMINVNQLNLLVFFDETNYSDGPNIISFDLEKKVVVSKIKLNTKSSNFMLHHVNKYYPIIAILLRNSLHLYNLLDGTSCMEILNCDTSFCFSVDGETFYVSKDNSIELYSTQTMSLIKKYPIEGYARNIICSHDNNYIAFDEINMLNGAYNFRNDKLCIIDLSTGQKQYIFVGQRGYACFVDESTFAFAEDTFADSNILLCKYMESNELIICENMTCVKWIDQYECLDPRYLNRTDLVDPTILQSEFSIQTPTQPIVIRVDPVTGKYCGFQILNYADCFSYNGKYIYKTVNCDKFRGIAQYRLCSNGKLTKKRMHPVDLCDKDSNEMFDCFYITNVCYRDKKLVERIGQYVK